MSVDIDDQDEAEDEAENIKDTWVSDLEVVFFDPPRTIGGHEVFAAAMVAGDLLLGLAGDMKMHKLELVKGIPSGATLRSLKS